MNVIERIASSMIVSLIGGFLIVVAMLVNPERAFVVWLLTVICCGLVVGRINNFSFATVVKRSVFPSLVLSGTPVLIFYYEAAVSWIKKPQELIPWTNVYIDPFSPLVIIGVLILWIAAFIGSFLFIGVALVGSRVILDGIKRLYHLGPEKVERVRLIILAIGGVFTAIITLLSIFGR